MILKNQHFIFMCVKNNISNMHTHSSRCVHEKWNIFISSPFSFAINFHSHFSFFQFLCVYVFLLFCNSFTRINIHTLLQPNSQLHTHTHTHTCSLTMEKMMFGGCLLNLSLHFTMNLISLYKVDGIKVWYYMIQHFVLENINSPFFWNQIEDNIFS